MLLCLQTSAEKAAWKYAKEHSLDLITILPNFVLGPVITSRVDGLSAQFMQVALMGLPLCLSSDCLCRSSAGVFAAAHSMPIMLLFRPQLCRFVCGSPGATLLSSKELPQL